MKPWNTPKSIDEPYLQADGFEDALIGFVWPSETNLKTAVYDRNKCIEILQTRDGMDEIDAIEYFEFNVAGAYVGPQTPFFFDRCDEQFERRPE